MYTDIQEPMLNATQEQVEYGPQKTYHTTTDNFMVFIMIKGIAKNTKIYIKFSLCAIKFSYMLARGYFSNCSF